MTIAKDDPLTTYGQYLHQDIGIGVVSTEELAARAIDLLQPEDRARLRSNLLEYLDQLSPSEWKGKLNRASDSWRFSSKGAHAFLKATLDQLKR